MHWDSSAGVTVFWGKHMPAVLILSLLQAANVPQRFWGLTVNELVTIVALILGPVLAVLTQLVWQHVKELRNQKLWVFGQLMSLRGFSVTPDWVKALNFIDVVFYKDEKVREKWKTLLTFLRSEEYKTAPTEKTRDLLAELLAEMAKELGFGYDFTHIKNGAYYPDVLVMADNDTFMMRQKIIAALDGKGTLGVRLVEEAPAPAMRTVTVNTMPSLRGNPEKK